MSKKPKSRFNPSSAKTPRGGARINEIAREKFRWRFSDKIELDGRWGWFSPSTKEIITFIIPKLHTYESMTWAEIEGPTGSHFVTVDGLCNEAQRRLRKLKIEDEELFSLRLSAKKRIWGIRKLEFLHLLWWDPQHEVCPSPR